MKITDWASLEPLANDEHITFEAHNGPRHCRLAGVVSGVSEVWLNDEHGEARLVAVLQPGDFELRFHIAGTTELKIVHPEGSAVFVRSFAKSQVVEKTTNETFTKIAQRVARNPQLEAILHTLKQNEIRRQAQMEFELNRIREASQNAAQTRQTVQPAQATDPSGTDGDVSPASAQDAGTASGAS